MITIEVFTNVNCAYCDRAKMLLQEKHLVFEERLITEGGNLHAFSERLPRVKTLPQIFINGVHIGGYEDLEIISKDGRLEEMTKS